MRVLTAARVLTLVTAGLAAMLPGGQTTYAQPRERQLFVSVIDRDGAPVTDLTADEFVVREDKVAREVLRVTRADAPLQIALLVDNSQPATPYIADLRRGLEAFLAALPEGRRHGLALITYGERPTIVVDWTRDLAEVRKGIGRVFAVPGSGAMLLEALIETARGLQRREAPRPVIAVLATEGVEFSTDHYTRVLDAIKASHAAVYTLVLATGASNPLADETRNRDVVLSQAPAETGGRRMLLLASLGFPEQLKRLAAVLTNQYLVTYARPDALIPPERVQVEVKRSGLDARATPVVTPGWDF